MALAFSNHQLYKAQTSHDLARAMPCADLLLDSPSDLFIASFPNTIYMFIEEKLGAETASKCGLRFNNPHAWFSALSKMAEEVKYNVVKKNFTYLQKQTITNPSLHRSPKMSETTSAAAKAKRQRVPKSMKIKKLKLHNPRNITSHGWKSWELIKDGMDIAAFLQLGGRIQDILWDVKKGNLQLY